MLGVNSTEMKSQLNSWERNVFFTPNNVYFSAFVSIYFALTHTHIQLWYAAMQAEYTKNPIKIGCHWVWHRTSSCNVKRNIWRAKKLLLTDSNTQGMANKTAIKVCAWCAILDATESITASYARSTKRWHKLWNINDVRAHCVSDAATLIIDTAIRFLICFPNELYWKGVRRERFAF